MTNTNEYLLRWPHILTPFTEALKNKCLQDGHADVRLNNSNIVTVRFVDNSHDAKMEDRFEGKAPYHAIWNLCGRSITSHSMNIHSAYGWTVAEYVTR